MPLKITLHKEIELSDHWLDKQAWDEVYKGDRLALAELLEEDVVSLLEQADGIGGLLQDAEWVDPDEDEDLGTFDIGGEG